jgi:hypothetical protein
MLVCASNVPDKDTLIGALQTGVAVAEYDYETANLAGVYKAVRAAAKQASADRFDSIALCTHGAPGKVEMTQTVSISTDNATDDDVTLFIGCLGKQSPFVRLSLSLSPVTVTLTWNSTRRWIAQGRRNNQHPRLQRRGWR